MGNALTTNSTCGLQSEGYHTTPFALIALIQFYNHEQQQNNPF